MKLKGEDGFSGWWFFYFIIGYKRLRVEDIFSKTNIQNYLEHMKKYII